MRPVESSPRESSYFINLQGDKLSLTYSMNRCILHMLSYFHLLNHIQIRLVNSDLIIASLEFMNPPADSSADRRALKASEKRMAARVLP